ncbi:hypothetical protein N9242_05145 [Vicingaceae bacterium]|nr:hypothetical protein [Vicingaceae bacterium]
METSKMIKMTSREVLSSSEISSKLIEDRLMDLPPQQKQLITNNIITSKGQKINFGFIVGLTLLGIAGVIIYNEYNYKRRKQD